MWGEFFCLSYTITYSSSHSLKLVTVHGPFTAIRVTGNPAEMKNLPGTVPTYLSGHPPQSSL